MVPALPTEFAAYIATGATLAVAFLLLPGLATPHNSAAGVLSIDHLIRKRFARP